MATIGTAILMVLIASYLAFVPVRVITPNIQPYKAITKEIEAGDMFIYEVDACKHIAKPSIATRRFVDEKGTRYPQPPESSNILPGCQVIRIPVATPSTLKPGVWYLDLEISYQINPLRTENYHFTTEKFTITDKKEK